MRSIWKGSISFGLVNIPVKLYAATEEKGVKFNSLHKVCGTQIRYRKHCPTCDVDVEQSDIIRGYSYEPGRFITIEDEDLDNLPVKTARQVEIVDFVALAEIDPIYYQKSYYLEPDVGAEKAYALLRNAMLSTDRVAIAQVAIRHKETLACVRVYDNALVLETMFYRDEIRSIDGLAGLAADPTLGDRELDMAVKLVENLSTPFDPHKYQDDYRNELLKLIQAKIEGRPEAERTAAPGAGKVVDLMEALEASLRSTADAKEPKARIATARKSAQKSARAKKA